MTSNHQPNGFDRADGLVGRIYCRLISIFSVTAAIVVFVNSVRADNFSVVGYWPSWIFILLMGLFTVGLWRSRKSMLTMLSN